MAVLATSDTELLSSSMTMACCAHVGHFYKFKRRDGVIIISGRRKGAIGVVGSAVFQQTVDYPEEYVPGHHVILGDWAVVSVQWDQGGLCYVV